MVSPNLSCHLLMCAAVMLWSTAPVVSFSRTLADEPEENCKFLFVPYTIQCINPNETIRGLISTRGLAAVCSATLSHRVVDTKNGTVEFSILLPHDAANEWIYLFALEPSTGDDQQAACSRNIHGKHSYFQLAEESENQTCSSAQLMEISWKANYLYTGCYMVKADLPSPEPGKNCTSEPFHVQTDFEMEPLAYQNLSVTRKSINDKLTIILEKDLVLNNDCSNPMISSSCIKIKLTLEEQDLPKAIATVYRNCPMVPLSENSLECSCDWKEPQLECTFHDLPVGNYCVQVEALDTRCVRDTVWVNSSLIKQMNDLDPCVWEICNLEIKNDTSRYVLSPEYPKRTPISWLIVVFAMGAIAAVCVSLYLRARKNLIYRAPDSAPKDDGPCEKLIEPPPVSQVVLLYARDCQPFMEAMKEFRELLQQTMDAQVFDIWDEKRRDELDTKGVECVWSLPSENTQVIVMATPITRVLEDGFISGNRRNYREPDSRDEIFISAFKTSIGMMSTHSNRCSKFVVARMNSVGCTENILTTFRPLCTIYTLPSRLDLLLKALNAQLLHNSYASQPFERKAEKFEEFVSSNPSYLDSILE